MDGCEDIGAVHMKIVFPLFSRLTVEINILSSRSYVKCFPGCVRFNFGELLGGEILWKTIMQNGWHKLGEKLLSFGFHNDIRTLPLILCLGEVLHLLQTERQQKNFIMLSLLISGQKRIRKKLKRYTKIKETLLLQTRKKWHIVIQFNARNKNLNFGKRTCF